MDSPATSAASQIGMSKHRIDALTDGIFAVAMTLLVIELKIPESQPITSNAELIHALVHLVSRFIGWIISFFVLAIFWYSHHRVFHFVRRVDGRLVALNILFLGFVSFMPFASGIAGAHASAFAAQVVYSGTMICLAVSSLALWRYVHRHPELCEEPMTEQVFRAAQFRNATLLAISFLAIGIAKVLPGAGNMAFSLMFFASLFARRFENRPAAALPAQIAIPPAAPAPSPSLTQSSKTVE